MTNPMLLLAKVILMSTHNVHFMEKLAKLSIDYHQICSIVICSTGSELLKGIFYQNLHLFVIVPYFW